MPQTLADLIDTTRGDTNGTDILAKQQSADIFIPNSGTANMNDLSTFMITLLTAPATYIWP